MEAIDKKMFIMRGVPGSGKSTYAKKLLNNFGINIDSNKILKSHLLSTDDFFYDENEIYRHDKSKLKKFHLLNESRAEIQMLLKCSPIIIDNTNIDIANFVNYYKLAKSYNYEVEIINPENYNSDENPIILDSKINKKLIYSRADKRRETFGEKDIPLEILDNMINKLETNMNITNEDVENWISRSVFRYPVRYSDKINK